ncbi:MAG TPA: hypothetical protein VND65_15005 [Candidatus Binatia bacterium]|nr:hypothetical protein [Candidatus Binatia bacterium]
MRKNWRSSVRVALCLGLWSVLAITAIVTFSAELHGQAATTRKNEPLTTDWSSRHLIFSGAANPEQAARLSRDVRYRQQQQRHVAATLSPEAPQADRLETRAGRKHGDWAQFLGNNATMGALNYPAKYSFNINQASCANDFAMFGTGLAGSTSQATIIAFNNLYSGCTGTIASTYWAYDTKGTMNTSPVFSLDGTQVAYMQTGGGYTSDLVLLKWAPSTTDTVSAPTLVSSIFRGFYPACVAPCATYLELNVGATVNADTNSSVFYDYDLDVAYVGDDAGYLHKFTPVFFGTPDQVTTGGWPVLVNPTTPTALESPVYDPASGLVFVTDQGGFLYSVTSSGTVTTSGQLDFSLGVDGGPGLIEGPIVDSNAGLVYVFATADGSAGCPGSVDCTGLYQLPTTFTSTTTPSEAIIGDSTAEGTTPNPLYLGAFDSTYENSATASGHLYVCGNTGGVPIVYQVAIGNSVLGTVLAGPSLTNGLGPQPACSPITDVSNPNASGGPAEWIFASVENSGVATTCASGGCIFNFLDTAWRASTSYIVGQEILDSNLHIQVVTVAGTSGTTEPFWNISTGGTTKEGSSTPKLTWTDQGSISAFPLPAWIRTHVYSKGTEILDANNNVELVTTAGTSGGTVPGFSLTAGGTVTDGSTLVWTNVGALATASGAETGGTSGMVIDNVVGSVTQGGASNIYFTTLGNQTCGTSGTGGCAIQASQAALQ